MLVVINYCVREKTIIKMDPTSEAESAFPIYILNCSCKGEGNLESEVHWNCFPYFA